MEPELNINDLWKVWQWDEKVKLGLLFFQKEYYLKCNHLRTTSKSCILTYAFTFSTPQWTQLKTRKQNLTRLFQKMQSYQFEQISADPDKPLADGIRPLDTADMERYVSVILDD